MLRTNLVWKLSIVVLAVLVILTLRPMKVQAVQGITPGEGRLSLSETAKDIFINSNSSVNSKPHWVAIFSVLPDIVLCLTSPLSSHHVSRAPPDFIA